MKQFIKNICLILKVNERRKLGMLIILDIVISVLDIAFLASLLFVIHLYTRPAEIHAYSFLPDSLVRQNSPALIILLVFLFTIKNICAFAIYRTQSRFIGKVATRLSEARLSNYLYGRFDGYVNTDSSVHIRKICFQPFEFCQYILLGILQVITQALLVLITIVAILLFDAKLFLLVLCILLPPVIAVFYIMKKRLAVAKAQLQSSNEKSFQHLLDALKGYVEGNIYNKNEFFLQRFVKDRGRFSSHLFDSLSIQSMPSRVIEIFAMIGLVLLILIAQFSGDSDRSSFLLIGAFMAAAYKIIPGVVKIINVSGQMKAYEFLLTETVQDHHKGRQISMHPKPLGIDSVTFRNVSFQQANMSVLNNFNLSIKRGELVGITGRSGRGKTTILNLLLGFYTPLKGQVLVNEVMADSESLKQYWPSISYVRQQPFLFHDTILRNITLSETEYDKASLKAAVENTGLDEFLSKLPNGLHQGITENGKNISGGQQQRIALARALYNEAELILLDEPFNELDETSEILLLELFRKLAADGKLVIIITHDSKSLLYCDKIVSLDEL